MRQLKREWSKSLKNMVFNLLKSKQIDKKKQYCLGLILREKEGEVWLLELDPVLKKVYKIESRQLVSDVSWEHLVDNVDEILFQFERDYNCKITEVIFFLYANLIDQQTKKIQKNYLEKIKNLTKEIQLTPLGYIDYHEALSIYLSDQENQGLTAFIIEVSLSKLSLFIYERGNLTFHEILVKEKETRLFQDFETLFAKIKGKTVFSSRVLVYDSLNLKEEMIDITAHRWSEDLFVQMPKFEIVSQIELEKALLFVFGRQLFEDQKTDIADEVSEVMGFAVGRDIREKNNDVLPVSIKEKKPTRRWRNLDNLLSMLKSRPRAIILILIILSISVGLFLSVLYFFHQASLIVYLKGKSFEKELQVAADLKDDSSGQALKLTQIETLVEKQDSMSTTGRITVGEKARGEVTIYNSDKAEKLFKKNTIFSSSRGVKFLLDSEVKVASASESLTNEGNVLTVTGKVKGLLIADVIGNEGNIDKNEKLKIEDFSQTLYFAISNNVFSGGAKKEIQTVAKDDMIKLKTIIFEKIKKDQSQTIKDDQNTGKTIAELTDIELTEEKYSKELGEEANTLSFSVKGKMVVYTYDEKELKKILVRLASGFAGADYELTSQNIRYKITNAVKKEKINLTLTIDAKAVMRLEQQKLIKDVLGKKDDALSRIIKEQYKAENFKVDIQSPFPFFKSRLPFFEKNIVLKVKTI